MTKTCNLLADDKFGPGVDCSQFDFTLTFEQSIFGIGISSVLLLLFPVRLALLRGATIKTSENTIYLFKIVCRPRS
jgi:ATP-binding cassette, subfamily C (CFTR/MRP), member 1